MEYRSGTDDQHVILDNIRPIVQRPPSIFSAELSNWEVQIAVKEIMLLVDERNFINLVFIANVRQPPEFVQLISGSKLTRKKAVFFGFPNSRRSSSCSRICLKRRAAIRVFPEPMVRLTFERVA